MYIQTYKTCRLSNGNPCSPCRRSIDLATEIAKAKQALEKLLQEQSQLHSEINNYHDPFMHRIPPEISTSIFELCLPEDWHTLDEREELTKIDISAPLVLGAVCRTWRRIAWSSPRLWTSISLVYKFSITELSVARLETAVEWLGRSGQYPLSISMYTDEIYPEREQKDTVTRTLMPFVTLINSYSHRWKHLDIQCTNELLRCVTGNSTGPLILDKLRIADDANDQTPSEFSMTGYIPAPTYVSTKAGFMTMQIDWSNVTHLEAQYFSDSELCEVLRDAQRLQYCDVMFIWPDHDDSDDDGLIVHHCLQSLILHQGEQLAITTLFDILSLPALESLEFQYRRPGDLPLSNLINLARNSGTCRLTTLSLEDMRGNGGQLIELLRHTPLLSELDLELDSDSDIDALSDLFQLLGQTSTLTKNGADSSATFLPSLTSFRVDTQKITKSSRWKDVANIFGPMSDVDNSPKRPLVCLSIMHRDSDKVDLYIDEFIDQADVLRFLQIAQAGVDLQFETCRGLDILKRSMEWHGITLHLVAGVDEE